MRSQIYHMKKIFLAFALLVTVPSSCTSTPSTAEVLDPVQDCRQLFQEAVDMTLAAIGTDDDPTGAIVVRTIEASECFLNTCFDPGFPPSTQAHCLSELKRLAQVVPASFDCADRYLPTMQSVDLDGDAVNELVLHTQAIRCDHYALLGLHGAGGMSIIFRFDEQISEWRGNLVWPCWTSTDDCPLTDSWVQSPQPEVVPLSVRDSLGRRYILVAGGYYGADHTGNLLVIWRWENNILKMVQEIRLSDWCETPNTWEITEEGGILIPAAEATYRCEARAATMYVLVEDKFVATHP